MKLSRLFDYGLAVITIGYGVYDGTWWIWSAGILGLIVAWYNPAQRVKAHLEKKFVHKRRTGPLIAPSVSDPVSESGENVHSSQAPQPQSAAKNYNQPIRYGEMRLTNSKHNMLLNVPFWNFYSASKPKDHPTVF